MSDVNHMTFDASKPEVKAEAYKFLERLIEYNNKSEADNYNDIHIYQEESSIIIEWTQVPYSREWGGEFKYVDEDEYIFKEIRLPDGHYGYAMDEEQEKEIWENFHKENPGWVKNSWGCWTNEIDNARLRKELGLDKEDK